jgi:hypothetical protein
MNAHAKQADAAAVQRGPVWLAMLLILSLLVPFFVAVGTVQLMPHRVVLLVAFIPLCIRVFIQRRAGPVLMIDWLLLASAVWAVVSLLVNHPFNDIIQGVGLHMLEFYGSYLLARVAIRSGDDFRRIVKLMFVIVTILLPFAVAESFTGRPIALDLIPGRTIEVIYADVRMGLRRAQTVFAHPILYGVFASTGLGLFWYVIRPKWLAIMSAPIVIASTFFSLSTAAILSVVIQSALISWETVTKFIRYRWKIFAVLFTLFYITIDILSDRTPFHVLVHYATLNSGSAYYRINIWNFGIQNVWANPVFGLGFHNWERPFWMGDSVDNYWLLLTMRHGIPAIIPFFVAIFLIFRQVSFAPLTDDLDNRCRAAYLTAIGGLIIAGGTVHFWHAMMTFVMFIFGSGLWAITGGGKRESDDTEPAEPDPAASRLRFSRQTARHVRPGAVPAAGAARARATVKANRG